MSPLKEAAHRAIDAIPDDASLDQLLEEIVYYSKVEEGLKDIREGRVTDLDEVMAKYGIDE